MAEGVGCVVDSENGSFHSQIYRERLLKQQYLHGNLLVQGNFQEETRELGKTVHTASQQVYANEHDEEKDCSFYRGKCHERVKVFSRIYAQSLAGLLLGFPCIKRSPCRYCCLSSLSLQAPSDLAIKRAVFAVNNTTNALSHSRITRK